MISHLLLGRLFVAQHVAGVLLVLGGILQLRCRLGHHLGNVLPDEVGLIHHISLSPLEVFGLGGVFFLLNLLGLFLNLGLILDGLFNVGNGLADDFFAVTLGGEDAGDVQHRIAGSALIAGGALKPARLEVVNGGLQGRFEIGLHQFQRQLGPRLRFAVELFVQVAELLHKRLGFVIDAHLIQLLQAQLDRGFLPV